MNRVVVFACALATVCTGVALADDAKSYGEGVTIEQAVAIDVLMKEPGKFEGKKVRVDGVVTGVCKHKGCWIHVTDPETGKGIRVKVEDGVIVFPYTAMGHKASAEGVFEAVDLTPEQVAQIKAQHEKQKAQGGSGCASEGGKTAANEKGQDSGCAPELHGDKVFLLRGTGAVIHA